MGVFLFVFFFQAEDGIRDGHVTGVQTCALPIFSEVVETEFGFHVIRLDERSGDNLAPSHILIEIDTEQVNESAASERLEALRDRVLSHHKSLDEWARISSEQEETRAFGCRLSYPQAGRRLRGIRRL